MSSIDYLMKVHFKSKHSGGASVSQKVSKMEDEATLECFETVRERLKTTKRFCDDDNETLFRRSVDVVKFLIGRRQYKLCK